MHILIVTQYYPPEIGAAQNRLSGLAIFLQKAGHTVTVLTAMPNYPTGEIYHEYRNQLVVRETRNGVAVVRTWLYVKQNLTFASRLIHYLSFSAMALFVSTYTISRQDIVLTESPPIFLGLAGWIISKFKRAKYALNVSDLWTDSAVDLGVLKNRSVISMALRFEKFLYKQACLITGQTQGIVETIRTRTSNAPVALITNGVDEEFFTRADHLNSHEQQDAGRFIVGFAGLHGLMQDLDTVLEAARLLREKGDIAFVFYGDGPKKEALIQQVGEGHIENVTFFPPQPADQMPKIFTSFDAMLVPLKDLPILRGAIPCKMLEAMAAGVPILLLAEGEAKRLIEQAECGIAIPPENAKLLAAAVTNLYHDSSLRTRLGKNGRQYALEHYNRQRINKRFEELLCKQHAVTGKSIQP
jgi:glycosyltransferase involved in cell wall biosynthesis